MHNAYKNYFREQEEDYDEYEYFAKKQLQKKILIISAISLVIGLIIVFNIFAFSMSDPFQNDKAVFKNDFTKVDEIIESGNNFGGTEYYS